ncbi:Uncharacterised protein [Mycobacteroides abscessus subsp. abscessus]|nr:Uncharacterised protein [Mycobacteroides abscessus subsp. abscessus]
MRCGDDQGRPIELAEDLDSAVTRGLQLVQRIVRQGIKDSRQQVLGDFVCSTRSFENHACSL